MELKSQVNHKLVYFHLQGTLQTGHVVTMSSRDLTTDALHTVSMAATAVLEEQMVETENPRAEPRGWTMEESRVIDITKEPYGDKR